MSTAAIRTAAAGAIAAGGLVAAGVVTTASLARRVLRTPTRRQAETAVQQVDASAGRIRFSVTDDSCLPGTYSFWFDGGRGHARIGAVLERTSSGVTRELLGTDAGLLTAASTGRFNGWVYLSPEALDLPFESVRVQTTVGAAPAWIVPSERDTGRWAVLVHGRATVRQEVLRAVPAFRDAGYSSLLLTYRNDGEAPASREESFPMGDTEWLDVESAVLFALDRGAQEIVLMGWSIGAAIVLQTATRSRVASVISGVVLESPVVSWSELLLDGGDPLPRGVKQGVLSLTSTKVGARLAGRDRPVDLGRLDFVAHADDLEVPVLILHSDDDGFAPAEASRRLAKARPDLVRLVPFRTARHTKLWNFDRARWEGSVGAWLRSDSASLARFENGQAKTGKRFSNAANDHLE